MDLFLYCKHTFSPTSCLKTWAHTHLPFFFPCSFPHFSQLLVIRLGPIANLPSFRSLLHSKTWVHTSALLEASFCTSSPLFYPFATFCIRKAWAHASAILFKTLRNIFLPLVPPEFVTLPIIIIIIIIIWLKGLIKTQI